MVANKHGITLLIAASVSGHVEVVKLLIGIPSVDAGKTDYLGRTALFFASRYGQLEVVQALLADGRINSDTRDWCGSTSLFAAVANGHLEVVDVLIAGGAPMEKQDRFGRGLIWWARRTGNPRVLQLLLQHAERAGLAVIVPDESASAMCGRPASFAKGYNDTARVGARVGSCHHLHDFGIIVNPLNGAGLN